MVKSAILSSNLRGNPLVRSSMMPVEKKQHRVFQAIKTLNWEISMVAKIDIIRGERMWVGDSRYRRVVSVDLEVVSVSMVSAHSKVASIYPNMVHWRWYQWYQCTKGGISTHKGEFMILGVLSIHILIFQFLWKESHCSWLSYMKLWLLK